MRQLDRADLERLIGRPSPPGWRSPVYRYARARLAAQRPRAALPMPAIALTSPPKPVACVSLTSRRRCRTGPLVLLIGAPLPPPYGGIARYMQLCLPAMARKGLPPADRAARPGRRSRSSAGLPPDADVETAVFSYPGARAARRAGSCGGPGSRRRLVSLYTRSRPRRPGFAAKAACGDGVLDSIRGEASRRRAALDHTRLRLALVARGGCRAPRRDRGGKSMVSLFGDVLPHLDELTSSTP